MWFNLLLVDISSQQTKVTISSQRMTLKQDGAMSVYKMAAMGFCHFFLHFSTYTWSFSYTAQIFFQLFVQVNFDALQYVW